MAISAFIAGLVISCAAGGASSGGPPAALTLEGVREALVDRASDRGQLDRVVAGISLAGFSWYYEMELGRGNRVFVISCNLGGGLIAFGRGPTLVSSMKTGEIVSAAAADLDEDGVAEVVTDEESGRGTGFLSREYVVYRVSPGRVKALWRGVSLDDMTVLGDDGTPGGRELTEGFVRVDPSRGGEAAHLVHFTWKDAAGACTERVFELRGDVMKLVSEVRRCREARSAPRAPSSP